jgi:hypothetical protein
MGDQTVALYLMGRLMSFSFKFVFQDQAEYDTDNADDQTTQKSVPDLRFSQR